MKRRTIALAVLVIGALLLTACPAPTPQIIEVPKEVVVEKEVIKTVEVVKEVPVEKVVKETVEIEVEKQVEVVVTATPEPAPPPSPKILRVAAAWDQQRMDPELPTDVTVGSILRVMDGLTRFDENFGVQPWLAESWEFDADRVVWVFHLRDDVYFHDGVKLTAQHIADYFNYFSIDSPMATLANIAEGDTVAVDDLTLEIASPAADLPAKLTHYTMGVRRGDAFAGEHIGTGAFIFDEYVPNEYIKVTANPDWWGGAPLVDVMELRFIPDPMTRLLALQAGELDLIQDPPRDAMPALQARSDIQLYDAVPSKSMQLDLNLAGPEGFTNLQDPAVREALAFGTDRQSLIDTAWGGFAVMAHTLIAPGLLGESLSLVEGYTFDPERAIKALEDSGWIDEDEDGVREKDGTRLRLRIVNGYPNANENGPVPVVLQAQWAELGIELEIVNVPDWAGLSSYLNSREADMFLETWSNTSPAPCMVPTWGFYLGENTNLWQPMMSPMVVGYDNYNELVDNCGSATVYADTQRWAAEAIHIVIDEARTSITMFGIYNSWAAGPQVLEFAPHPDQGLVRYDTTVLAD